jgi:hypothetical protein
MEVDLANIVFSWLLRVDLACIVCNWDQQDWTVLGASGLAGLAITAAVAGDMYNSYTSSAATSPVVQGGATGAYDGPELQIPGGGTGPLEPGSGNQPVDPHTLPPPPNAFDSDTAIEDKIAADEAEQRRQRDLHPGDTTAPPAPKTGGAFFDKILTFGHEQKAGQ